MYLRMYYRDILVVNLYTSYVIAWAGEKFGIIFMIYRENGSEIAHES